MILAKVISRFSGLALMRKIYDILADSGGSFQFVFYCNPDLLPGNFLGFVFRVFVGLVLAFRCLHFDFLLQKTSFLEKKL